MKLSLCAFSLLIAAQGAAAQEMSLNLSGATLNFTPQMEGGRTGFSRFAQVDAVSIEGGDGMARLVLELAFASGARAGDQPHDARISYRPQGWRDYWVSAPLFPAGGITIDELDLSGLEPRIAGSFRVELCLTRSPVHVPDPDHCQPASGRFTTPLMRD